MDIKAVQAAIQLSRAERKKWKPAVERILNDDQRVAENLIQTVLHKELGLDFKDNEVTSIVLICRIEQFIKFYLGEKILAVYPIQLRIFSPPWRRIWRKYTIFILLTQLLMVNR